MSASRSWLSIFSAALLAGLFAGCANLQPIPDSGRFYTLTPPAGAEAPRVSGGGAARVGVHVGIRADYLRRPAMVVRVSDNELRFQRDHRWAGRLDDALEQAIASALQPHLGDAVVAPVSAGSRAGAAVLVEIQLAACEGTGDGAAVLEAFWKITTSDPSGAAASGHFRERREGWNGADFGQLAAMLSALAGELSATIAPKAQAAAPAPGL